MNKIMASIKSFTDISQSKKLAGILPIESADMYYISGDEGDICFGSGVYEEIADWLSDGTSRPADIPCWNLAALLDVLPNKIVSHETAFEEEDAEDISDTYYKHIELTEDGRYMCCYVGNGYKYKCVADNPVDACVTMIEKLYELKML